jgi:hypothetical protein
MATRIKTGLGKFNDKGQETELRALLTATQADLAALRASIVGITAQLDTDAGVTGTNFAANNNPAALNLVP